MTDPATRDALVLAKIEHLDPAIKFHEVSAQIQNILGVDELMPEHKEIIYDMLKMPVLRSFLEGAVSKTEAAKSNLSMHNMLAATKFIKLDGESLIVSFLNLYAKNPDEVQDFIDNKNKQVKRLLTAMGVASTSIMNSQFATEMDDERTTKCFPEYSAAMKQGGKFPDKYQVSGTLLAKYKIAHKKALQQAKTLGLPVEQIRFSWSGMNPADGMLVMAERFTLQDRSGKDRIVVGVMHNEKVSLQALDLDSETKAEPEALQQKIELAHKAVYF